MFSGSSDRMSLTGMLYTIKPEVEKFNTAAYKSEVCIQQLADKIGNNFNGYYYYIVCTQSTSNTVSILQKRVVNRTAIKIIEYIEQ